MLVRVQVAVRSEVEQLARRVVRAGRERLAVREEVDAVDIALVARERLHGLAYSDVPDLRGRVARTRHEGIRVGRAQRNRHDVSRVVLELGDSDALLNVPQHTRHVSTRGHDLPVVDEPTARQIPRVRAQLPRHLHLSSRLSRSRSSQRVDRADVVQSTARNVLPRRRVGTRHDPAAPERNGVNFIRGVSVPDDQLAVLRRRDQMTTVVGPLQSVDFG